MNLYKREIEEDIFTYIPIYCLQSSIFYRIIMVIIFLIWTSSHVFIIPETPTQKLLFKETCLDC